MKNTKPLQLLALISIALSAVFVADAAAQNAAPLPSTPLKMDRLSPAIARIVPAGAKLELVASGYSWTEGTVWVKDRLYFADIPGNSIHT